MPHIRRDRKKLKNGEERVYVSIAHNVVEKPDDKAPRAKPVILARLGHEDDLDEEAVDGILGALVRYRRKRFGSDGGFEEVASAVRKAEPALRLIASRHYGIRVIVEKVWNDIGLAEALCGVAGHHCLSWDLERIVFAMVLHRLVDPGSKLACNDWVTDEVWFPEAKDWDVHHFYRALDHLHAHADEVVAAVRDATISGERPDADGLVMRLIDTTSSYFETDFEDGELTEGHREHGGAEGEAPAGPVESAESERLRKRGKSKDHRPDKPQVVIGMVCDDQGRPLYHQVYPGNTNDQRVTVGLAEEARASCPEGRVVAGCDSGMGGTKNLRALDELGLDRVTGVPLRSLAKAEAMLQQPGRWRNHPTKPNFRVRVMNLSAEESPTGRAEIWLATRNMADRKRVLSKLSRDERRVREALGKDNSCDAHGRPTCKLLANQRLAKFVKTTKRGQLAFDKKKMAVERRRAGVKVIRSTLTDLDPQASLRIYDALLDVERGFRDLKGAIKLRPMHHRVPRRIRAHVLVCMLALRVMRDLEVRTGRTFHQLRKLFNPIRAAQMESPRARHWQRQAWTPEALQILEVLGVGEVPEMWGVAPVEVGSNGV